MAFAAGSFGFVEFISKQTFLSVHIDKKLAVQKITPQIHEVVLSYIQPRKNGAVFPVCCGGREEHGSSVCRRHRVHSGMGGTVAF